MTIHKIINASCYDAIKDIPDGSIDLVITDPPYEIGNSGGSVGCCNKTLKKRMKRLKGIDEGFNYNIFKEIKRVCNKTNLYIFCSILQLYPVLKYNEGLIYDVLTWHKNNPPPLSKSAYLPDTEYVVFLRDRGAPFYGDWRTKSKYYITSNAPRSKYDHPTIKPEELVERFIINSSKAGDTILDPFAGSGTTAAVAKRLGRNSISIEIEKKYCDIIERRLDPENQIHKLPLFKEEE